MIKIGSKSWILTWSNITVSLPASYTVSALHRKLNTYNNYLYFFVKSLQVSSLQVSMAD